MLLVGQAFHSVETTAPCFVSTPELLHYMKEETIKGKLILIKGSRGMQLEKAADLL